MTRIRFKVFGYFLLLALSAPLALVFAEAVTGFATVPDFFAAWSWGVWLWWIVSAGVAGTALWWALGRLEAGPRPALANFPPLFLLVWGPVNNAGFSFFLHAGSSYAPDLGGQLVTALYAGAVGLYFGVLGGMGVVSDLEVLVPFRDGGGNRRLTGSLNHKLFQSVSLPILAFLFGGVGVALMPIHAGMGIVDAIGRMVIVAFPFLLLTLILVAFLSRLMTVPLIKASPLLEALGRDDLTAVLEEASRDELGLVFHNLNTFLGRLRTTVAESRAQADRNGERSEALDVLVDEQVELLGKVVGQVTALEGRLEKMGKQASQGVEGAHLMTQTVESLRSDLEVQTRAVEETSAAAEELLAGARNIAEVARSRRQVTDALASRNEDNRRALHGALEAMTTVTAQIESLTELNKVIAKVASQTNLLAMNAAIEAAHAGDAGRGFSVVAQEIRSLAESSAQNAKNSSTFLKGVVESIRRSGESLGAVDRSFLEGQAVTGGVVEGFEEIGTGSAEIEEASRLIVERMTKLKEFSHTVNERAGSLDLGLAGVSTAAGQSRKAVDESRGETRSIREAAVRLEALATETGRGSEALKADSETLARRFEQFKLPG